MMRRTMNIRRRAAVLVAGVAVTIAGVSFSAAYASRFGNLGVLASLSQSYRNEFQSEAQNYYRTDEAGNLWATLRGESERALLIGGHIDSVPNGGWPGPAIASPP